MPLACAREAARKSSSGKFSFRSCLRLARYAPTTACAFFWLSIRWGTSLFFFAFSSSFCKMRPSRGSISTAMVVRLRSRVFSTSRRSASRGCTGRFSAVFRLSACFTSLSVTRSRCSGACACDSRGASAMSRRESQYLKFGFVESSDARNLVRNLAQDLHKISVIGQIDCDAGLRRRSLQFVADLANGLVADGLPRSAVSCSVEAVDLIADGILYRHVDVDVIGEFRACDCGSSCRAAEDLRHAEFSDGVDECMFGILRDAHGAQRRDGTSRQWQGGQERQLHHQPSEGCAGIHDGCSEFLKQGIHLEGGFCAHPYDGDRHADPQKLPEVDDAGQHGHHSVPH